MPKYRVVAATQSFRLLGAVGETVTLPYDPAPQVVLKLGRRIQVFHAHQVQLAPDWAPITEIRNRKGYTICYRCQKPLHLEGLGTPLCRYCRGVIARRKSKGIALPTPLKLAELLNEGAGIEKIAERYKVSCSLIEHELELIEEA
jgi:hypothetical protein